MTGEPFAGFLAGGAAVALPAQFFTEVLPLLVDEAELRVTLYTFYAIARGRGPLRAVRRSQLEHASPLLTALAACGGNAVLQGALRAAVTRGTLLTCALADGDALYLVNSEAGRRALLRVTSGALAVPGNIVSGSQPAVERAARPAQVYEQEIGLLSPAVAEALARAAERWPETWIVEALQIAAQRNARSWRYAEAILAHWEAEGRDDGTLRDATGKAAGRDHGPYDRFILRS